MTTQIITPTDSPDNLTIEDTDVLAWADALCEARAQLAYAGRAVEYAIESFTHALRRHFEACATMEQIDQSADALLTMLRRWDHVTTSDYVRLDGEILEATTRILRAMPYDEYLQSDHWQDTREFALGRAGHRCQVCNTNDERLEVHHRTYERRGEEFPEDLIVLCRTCHETFHKNGRLAR
jgi:hypothetical protein